MGKRPSSPVGQRLHGGYLNSVTHREGHVDKDYTGRDAETRRHVEHCVLDRLRPHFPVPGVTSAADNGTLVMQFVDGTNGQDLIREGHTDLVLRLCGQALRRLHTLDPAVLGDAVPRRGPVIVHGDFGPQNMLVTTSPAQVTAVVDWEFCHLGAPIEDLAWAEWIVRRHHPKAVEWLPALFDGYGHTPHWTLRHHAMVQAIQRMRSFVDRNGHTADVHLWTERLDDVLTWTNDTLQLTGRPHNDSSAQSCAD